MASLVAVPAVYGQDAAAWLQRAAGAARSLNYVAPDLSELEAELKFVREWFARVRKYQA